MTAPESEFVTLSDDHLAVLERSHKHGMNQSPDTVTAYDGRTVQTQFTADALRHLRLMRYGPSDRMMLAESPRLIIACVWRDISFTLSSVMTITGSAQRSHPLIAIGYCRSPVCGLSYQNSHSLTPAMKSRSVTSRNRRWMNGTVAVVCCAEQNVRHLRRSRMSSGISSRGALV